MKKAIVLMTAVMFLAVGATAYAAIDLSRHDMGAMGGAFAAVTGAYGDCSSCHVPHKAQGAKLWPITPPAYDVSYGLMGRLCARCHDGVSVAAAISVNLSYGPYSAPAVGLTGHRLNVNLTPDQPKGAAGSGLTDVEGSGFPYTAAADRNATAPWSGNYMECTSCHDVHNAQSNRPFIALSGALTGLNNLCVTCHTQRVNAGLYGAANALGLHPVDNAGTITGDMGVNGDNPILAGMGQIAIVAGTGLAADASAWNSGQHLIAGGAYCTSCHVIHGDEPTGYAEDGTVPQGTYDSSLLFSEQLDAGNTRNQFCEACHQGDNANQGGAAGELPNPGDTPAGMGDDAIRTWHPADAGLENGAGRIVAITEPAGYVFAGGAGGRVVCTSCHSAHGGLNAGTVSMTASPMLRNTAAAAPYASFCMTCHDAVNTAALDCFHAGHIAGDGSGGALGAMAPVGLGTAWGTAPVNGLDCNSCHQAHNAPYAPVLRVEYSSVSGTANPDAICTTCHTVNPSTFTTAAPFGAAQSLASHFVGRPSVAAGGDYEATGYGIAAGNYDAFPIPENVAAWPTTESSVYGGTLSAAGRGDMTCLSCHSMSFCGDGAAAIDETGDGQSNYMVITSSGNDVNQPAGFSTAYLCSGCHGADPITMITGGETGFTHPTAAATASVDDPKVGWTMTKSANLAVNCESCHRPHDADTDSGTYILEGDATGSGVYNGTNGTTIMPAHAHDIFCNGCHTK